jgi:REP element-mobilizing transposase RayT
MSFRERHLPHWQPEDAALFVTWRLHGSKPRNCDAPRDANLTAGQRFVLDDREWDRAATGPRWLSDDRIAKVVADALHYGEVELKLYTLHAWVIMSNHVHVLIDPQSPLSRITKCIKNYTARQANAILERAGPFWQAESYDRWIRTEDQFQKTIRYIEENPVAIDLCGRPEDWKWSSSRTGQEAYPT